MGKFSIFLIIDCEITARLSNRGFYFPKYDAIVIAAFENNCLSQLAELNQSLTSMEN